ncbi:PP2C family protein-serine/threonine phosphatase [Flammeovirga aprica]|uniref:SpoIIE family protein phosphatase n=1 Tax=Flammeovirga aprica JL-4 TaxID=694437 RepID=A0A7X9XCB1_9BACT|nr:SpoIIE family protein phosphatase [Flammeovirga aprica]NME71444.1 SpoIIE family protein phosphatase [Flammeovirga aprica JL-4]
MFRKIQSSIFSYFFTIVILALFVLVVVVNSILTRFENKAVEERMEDVTLAIADYLSKTVNNEERTATLLSETLNVEDIIEIDQLYSSITDKELTSKEWKKVQTSSFYQQNNGDSLQSVLQYYLDKTAKRKKKVIPVLINHLEHFQKIADVEEVILMDKEKILASSKRKELTGKPISGVGLEALSLPNQVKLLQNKTMQWIDLANFLNVGKRVFLLSKVPHTKGKSHYLLYVYDARKWDLNAQLNNVEKSETVDIYLIGKDGKLRSSIRSFNKNPSEVLLRLSQQGVSEKELSKAKKENSIIGLLEVPEEITMMSNNNIMALSEGVSVNGLNAIFMTHWLKSDGIDWRVVVEWGKDEAFAEWYKVRFYLNALLLIIGIFFLLGVIYGGRRLAKPIYALKNALDDLAEKPLTFNYMNFEEKGITNDMLQKMDIIGSEVKRLHEVQREMEKKLSDSTTIVSQQHKQNESLTSKEHQLTAENKVANDKILELEQVINTHYKSVKKTLKLGMYDSSLYHLSLESYFHIHKAKEEISGDFICTYERDSRVFFFLGDTGKDSIKAALSRMVITSIINEVVNVKRLASASRILEAIHKNIFEITKSENLIFEKGIKLSVCVWDRQKQMLEFSGLNQAIFVLRDDNFEELIGDELIGETYNSEGQFIANTHYIPLNRVKNALLYLFSDGMIHQNNNEEELFTQKRLKELLIDVHSEDLNTQKEYIEKTFIEWKGEADQKDDASILGLKLI